MVRAGASPLGRAEPDESGPVCAHPGSIAAGAGGVPSHSPAGFYLRCISASAGWAMTSHSFGRWIWAISAGAGHMCCRGEWCVLNGAISASAGGTGCRSGTASVGRSISAGGGGRPARRACWCLPRGSISTCVGTLPECSLFLCPIGGLSPPVRGAPGLKGQLHLDRGALPARAGRARP